MDTHDSLGDGRPAGSYLTGSHLTDVQFTGLLLGEIPPAVTAHLDACPLCAEEAQRVSSAIGSFEQQSRLWAERRAASRPMQTPERHPLLAWLRLPATPAAWSTAAVLALGVAIGIGFNLRTNFRKGTTVAVAPSAPAVRPAAVSLASAQPAREVAQVTGVLPATGASGVTRPARITPAVLKADNELLSAIDGELSASDAPSPSIYGLTVSSHRGPSRPVKGITD